MKETVDECPYRLISHTDGILCFDPWLAEYVKPSDQTVREWCSRDYRKCPGFLNYRKNFLAGMRKHFML